MTFRCICFLSEHVFRETKWISVWTLLAILVVSSVTYINDFWYGLSQQMGPNRGWKSVLLDTVRGTREVHSMLVLGR